MSLSKEFLIHKWETVRHIIAASLLGVSAIAAGGTEASSRFERILQEVPTPVVVPERQAEEVEQEEQEPQSGIQATIPPTPVVLVLPTPSAEVIAGGGSRDPALIANVQEAQRELLANLPEFTGQGYQTFTYNGEQVPFGMIDSRDINVYIPGAEEWDLSTHAVAVTDVERQTFEWPGYPDFPVEYLFVAFQYENMKFVASYGPYQLGVPQQFNVENVRVARDNNPSQTSRLRITMPELEARYRQAMQNNEQVIIQNWSNTTAAGYQNSENAQTRALEEYQSTGNELLIEAVRTGNVSPQAGIDIPNTVIFLNQ